MKKALSIFLVSFLLLIIGGYFLIKENPAESLGSYCPFCDRKVLDYQKFFENDTVLGLYTYKPIVEGHCLIIPKRHVQRFEELTESEILEMSRLIKKVNLAVSKAYGTTGYLLLQKNGWEAFQTVPHVHFHYIPRTKDKESALFFLSRFFYAYYRDPISSDEMQENIQKISSALNEQE